MNFLKKMVQAGVVASLLYSGAAARAGNEHDFVVYGSLEAKHEEYVKRGYFKAPESAKYGFSLYLNQTNPVTLSRLEQQLAKLPLSLRSALKEIRINNQDETAKGNIGGRGGTGGALAIYAHAGLTNGNFFHECGHVWFESLAPEKKQKFLERWNAIAQFEYGSHNATENKTEWKSGAKVERWRSLGTHIDTLKPLLAKEKAELETSLNRLENDSQGTKEYLTRVADFNARAEEFNKQSEEFTKDIEEYNLLIPSRNEPREGVFSAYGATERDEDIAEAWKTLLHSPAKARALLNDPDPRYAAKMRLLAKQAGIKLEGLLK